MKWRELRSHVFSLPDRPEWIPYRTAFFEDAWGFCVPHALFEKLETRTDEEYEVSIDTSLEDGSLTYGEVSVPGETSEEVLIWAHVCHPSLANDNLSGIAVATFLADHVRRLPRRRYSYRFAFGPATIGAITWLSRNEERVRNVKHGLVLTLLGDRGGFTYKRSRRGSAQIDRVIAHVLRDSGEEWELRDFSPLGYDERQFCSPGFDLPMGCLMRTANGEFPEYHTSADDLGLVDPASLAKSYGVCTKVIEALEHDQVYVNQNPKCEPRLGSRGLYRGFGCGGNALQEAVLWILNLADGSHSLLEIAERSGMAFSLLKEAADSLLSHALIGLAGDSHSARATRRDQQERENAR
jgi:aminopeptidase-like protein